MKAFYVKTFVYLQKVSPASDKCLTQSGEKNACNLSSASSCMASECSECAPKSFLASKLAENETLDSSESEDSEGDSQDIEYLEWCGVDGKIQKVLINACN